MIVVISGFGLNPGPKLHVYHTEYEHRKKNNGKIQRAETAECMSEEVAKASAPPSPPDSLPPAHHSQISPPV